MTRDRQMWSLVKTNPNLGVPWYLMASYAYYELDSPILSDAAFDDLAKFLKERWDTIQHRHKGMITMDDLDAGSLLHRDFPEIVKGATAHLIRDMRSRRRSRRKAPRGASLLGYR